MSTQDLVNLSRQREKLLEQWKDSKNNRVKILIQLMDLEEVIADQLKSQQDKENRL